VKYPWSGPTGKLSRMFGVYDENSGWPRGAFIISPDGRC